MVAPSVQINLFDLTVFAPQVGGAIMGCIGPATKGPVNSLQQFTDAGNFVNFFGRPANARYYSQRAGVRYLERGSNLKFVRVAGPNLASAQLTLSSAEGTPILRFTASSPGSWANDGNLRISILHNGTQSYNVLVYFLDQLVEQFVSVDNGIIVTRINNESSRITVALLPGAGATFPAETVNPVTQAVDKIPFAGGDDGALAKSDSASSTTSGAAGRRFFGRMHAIAGSRVFQNILTIGTSIAGDSDIYGSVDMPVVPGSFSIRVQTAVGPTYVELADDGDLSYGPGGAGVGLLIPAAGAHRGFIDYRTGRWGVRLSAATAFLTGTIDGVWIRAASELVGAAARGEGTYAGTLSQGPVGLAHWNANRTVFTFSVDEAVGDALPGAGAASSQAALKTLAGWIVPGTIVLTPSHPTDAVPPPIYDDGFGGFRTLPAGAGVPVPGGAIDYRTGIWVVTTWDPVLAVAFTAGGSIRGEYDIQVIDMGGGVLPGDLGTQITDEVVSTSTPGGATVANTDANSQAIVGPIRRGNVRINLVLTGPAIRRFYDDGLGGWLDRPRGDPRAVAVTGSIDYVSGAWTITPPAAVVAATLITVDYTSVAEDDAVRTLRGTGPQFQSNVIANAAGMDDALPASANAFLGTNFLDHRTGQWGIALDLVETGDRTFNLKDNGSITAVYVPASILGFGDGTTTTFVGTMAPAPFRRQANRLQAFQAAQASASGAGEPQTSFAALGVTLDDDFWSQNVVASTDPDNFLVFSSGETSIQWTSAPLADEAVFTVAEEVVLHFVAKYPGDIGNERTVIADGFRVVVGADPTLANSLRARVMFGLNTEESFGQALNLDELVAQINDGQNGSDLVTAVLAPAGQFLDLDVTADQTIGLAGAFTIADVIGVKQGQTYTGLQMFANFEVIDVDFLMIPGQWHRQVITAMQTLVETPGRRAIGIVPMPDADDPFPHDDFLNGNWNAASPGGIAVAEVRVPYPPLVEIASRLMTDCAPWVGYFDAYNNVDVFEPAEGDMTRLLASTPRPWFPAAGERRGRVIADQIRYSASRGDRDQVQGIVGSRVKCLNLITQRVGLGLRLMNQQTLYRLAGSALGELSVSWTINLIMNGLDILAQTFLFEINDETLWREAQEACNRFLRPIIERRGLQDAFVVIDGTTTLPEDIDAGRMRGTIFIKPSLPAKFIVLSLVLTPAGASFEEVTIPG
jgi:hypothetical protein